VTLPSSGEPGQPEGPYRGLAPFGDDELDALLFFGREREREVIAANLMASPLTIMYGPSGAGKTSVLRAGVAHDLRGAAGDRANGGVPDLAIAVVDSWRDDPVDAVLTAVGAELESVAGSDVAGAARGAGSLADALTAWTIALDGDLYVVLDQFDEYLLYHESEDSEGSLARELPRALTEPGLRVGFLICLREDQLARLDRFKGRIPGLFGNSLRLDRLRRDAARTAILGPLERYASLGENGGPRTAEPELVEAVLDEVAAAEAGTRDTVEAPYLQLVMQRVWHAEAEAGSAVLRLETLRRLGGAGRVVHGHLEEAMATLDPAQQDIAASVFNHLVTPSGTKIAHGVADLAAYANVAESDLAPVLSTLAGLRILRPEAAADGSGETRYEIFHDVLADPVSDWRRARGEERRLEVERSEARKRHRRLLVLVAASLLGLAIAIGLAIFALTQRSEAREQAERAQLAAAEAETASKTAENEAAAAEKASLEADENAAKAENQKQLAQARGLAAVALTEVDVDPELGILLAVEAAKIGRDPENVRTVLTQALLKSRTRFILDAEGPVNAAVYNGSGSRIVTASDDGNARIYSAKTGKPLQTLEHDGPVVAAAFSPDDKLVATASKDHTAVVWDAATGDRLAVLEHGGEVTSLAWHPDGTKLLTGSQDHLARVWTIATKTPAPVLRHPAAVTIVAFDSSGERLLTAALDFAVRVWDANGDLIDMRKHRNRVSSASFQPHGELVLTSGTDKAVRLWVPGGGPGDLVLGPKGPFFDAEFSPSGLRFATASSDAAARIFSINPTPRRRVLMTGHQNHVLDAMFNPADQEWLATASRDRTARTWSAATGAAIAILAGHRDAVTSVEWSPNGRWLLTASYDKTARVFDPGTGVDLVLLGRHRHHATSAAFSEDGKLVLSAGDDGTARIWQADGSGIVATLRHGGNAAISAAFDRDAAKVVTGSSNGSVRLWKIPQETPLWTVLTATPVNDVAISQDGSLVAGGTDRGARIWDENGELVARIPGRWIVSIAFSFDGSRIVTAGVDRRARIVDASSGEVLHVLRGHTGRLVDAEFSRNGRFVVTASADSTARIWNAATGELLHTLEGHRRALTSASFSPDSRLVVTTSSDTDGRTWRVATGDLVQVLRGHLSLVTDAAFSPDSARIVTAGPETAGLWDTQSGLLLARLNGHQRLLTSASFARDGQRILTSSRDGTVRIFNCEVCLPLRKLVPIAESRLERMGRELSPAERDEFRDFLRK